MVDLLTHELFRERFICEVQWLLVATVVLVGDLGKVEQHSYDTG